MSAVRFALACITVCIVPSVVLSAEPKTAQEYVTRAVSYFTKGKHDEALADCTEALRLDPKNANAFYVRGLVYGNASKYALAIADYTQALRLQADFPLQKELAQAVKALRKTGVAPKIVSIRLDEELQSKVVKKSQPIRLAANTEKVVEDTVRVQHSVTIKDSWKAEAEVSGKVTAWFVEVETAVRGGIEQSTSRMYGTETERKRNVTIKGTGAAKGVRIVWVEYYRTGIAKMKVDGVEFELPFEFRDDFDLLTEDEK